MEAFAYSKVAMPEFLAQTAFSDRKGQFIDRLGWDLCVSPNGLEVDEYDDGFSQYLAVHENGKHLGSCRVRPTTKNTMLTDHFLTAFPEAKQFLAMQNGRVFELTRFCRAPDISVKKSRLMLRKLAALLDKFRDEQVISGYVAVVFPHVARFLDLIGTRYVVVSESTLGGKKTYLICITHAQKVN